MYSVEGISDFYNSNDSVDDSHQRICLANLQSLLYASAAPQMGRSANVSGKDHDPWAINSSLPVIAIGLQDYIPNPMGQTAMFDATPKYSVSFCL